MIRTLFLLSLLCRIPSSYGTLEKPPQAEPKHSSNGIGQMNRLRSNELAHPSSPFRSSEHDQYRRILTEFIWEQRGQTLLPTPIQEDVRIGLAVDISGDGMRMAFATAGNSDTPGWARVVQFDAATQTWNILGQDMLGTSNSADRFGESIALSADGTTLAVGATQSRFPNIPRPPGFVRLYRYNSGTSTWDRLGQDITGEDRDDQFGWSVALSSNGRIVAAGAPNNQGTSLLLNRPGGHVRVFSLNTAGTVWNQLGADIDGDAQFSSTGNSIALSPDGRVLGIGGRNDALEVSLVRVFEFITDSASWIQRGNDLDGPGSAFLRQHIAFSNDGSVLAASDPNQDSSGPSSGGGRVRVYRYNGSTSYDQQGNDILGEGDERWGATLDLSADGRTLAVSASGSFINNIPARTIIFQQTGNVWRPISQDIISSDSGFQVVELSSDGTVIVIGDFSFDANGAVRVFAATDQTPRPTFSPRPTVSPTLEPTFTPPPPTPVVFCLSGDSNVQVQDREGETQVQDLNLGDKILVGENTYEPVYSFGHKLPSVRHDDFLQITLTGNNQDQRQLTLTRDHMVFVGSAGRAIPASFVQVGHELQSSEDGSETLLTVSKIESVASSGLYAPFTPSGTLIVDGVRVSSFASVQGSEMVHVMGFSTGVSHHWLSRTLKIPHRIWCYDLGLCSEEEEYVDGMSTWMLLPHDLYVWWTRQGLPVQTLVAIPFTAWVLLLAFVDAVFIRCPFPMARLISLVSATVVMLFLWLTRSKKVGRQAKKSVF